jgi:hypothetical protein
LQAAETMIKERLDSCREIYEEEFAHLAKQFHDANSERNSVVSECKRLRAIICDQENQILDLLNASEAIGFEVEKHRLEKKLDRKIEGEDQEKHLQFVVELNENPDAYSEELHRHIKCSDQLLAAPFNFYNFSVRLSLEEQIDIANRSYIRYYKNKINDLLEQQEMMRHELDSVTSLMDEFKKTINRQARRVQELETRDKIVTMEK